MASLMSWSRVLFMIACAKKMDGEGVNRCNCDANDGTWRRDTGTLTDKRTIPVKEMRFGDSQGSQELALYRLGEFKCTGKGKGFSRVETVRVARSWRCTDSENPNAREKVRDSPGSKTDLPF